MHRVAVALVGVLALAAACAPVRPPLNINHAGVQVRPAVFDAGVLKIDDRAPMEMGKGIVRSVTSPEQMAEFHDAVKATVGRVIIARGNSERKVTVRLDRISLTSTFLATKQIPWIGLLAFGEPERYTAAISGAVEVENEKCQVLGKTDFAVSVTDERPALGREILDSARATIEHALTELSETMNRQCGRYLHPYLIGEDNG